MLRQTVEQCPDALWADASYQNPFWRVAYHVLIYTHFYLGPREEDFVPWEKHQPDLQRLGQPIPGAESGFDWLPFNKLELQFYNIRHIQQHTGELCERLGAKGEVEVGWVGRGRS